MYTFRCYRSVLRIWGRSPPLVLWFLLTIVTETYGGCEFPLHWSGHWFQGGVGVLHVNRTNIETKGECYDSQGDKFMLHDRTDNCFRCMVIHEKHYSVLQYKETYCDEKATLAELCNTITGDAALYSMFRKQPVSRPVACPFKAAPFTFTYNRGSGECANPPSRADSCTDDSRLVLRYQACPDIPSTESNVEELVCLATWKEGSTRYLVGRLSQTNRRSALATDEDQYRCFVYERLNSGSASGNRVTYNVAQSGDATCNGIQNAVEGSRTMRLTTVDSHYGRCKFPAWITDHHTWFSLDHMRTYKFSVKNTTLKITTTVAVGMSGISSHDDANSRRSRRHDDSALGTDEIRVVCHNIVQTVDQRRVQIVAHVTAGCDSGYMCMVFHKRDPTIIEFQKSDRLSEATDDVCDYFNPATVPFTTLIAPVLHPSRCPHPGRYSVLGTRAEWGEGGRRRREIGGGSEADEVEGVESGAGATPECLSHDYEALAVGCGSGAPDTMEFRSACPHQPISAYTCHGSWKENNTHYLIASPVARKSTDALRYCLVYTFDGETSSSASSLLPQQSGSEQTQTTHHHQHRTQAEHRTPPTVAVTTATLMRLSGLADSCHRHVVPGVSGLWAFNFTTNGACTRTGETGAAMGVTAPPPHILAMVFALVLVYTTLLCR